MTEGNGSIVKEFLAPYSGSKIGYVTVERIDGGEGPGWSGRVYDYQDGTGRKVECQVGPCGRVSPPNHEAVEDLVSRYNGGTYAVTVFDGKNSDRIILPPRSGEPKPLPIDDPAAKAQAERTTEPGPGSDEEYIDEDGFYHPAHRGTRSGRGGGSGWVLDPIDGWRWIGEGRPRTRPPEHLMEGMAGLAKSEKKEENAETIRTLTALQAEMTAMKQAVQNPAQSAIAESMNRWIELQREDREKEREARHEREERDRRDREREREEKNDERERLREEREAEREERREERERMRQEALEASRRDPADSLVKLATAMSQIQDKIMPSSAADDENASLIVRGFGRLIDIGGTLIDRKLNGPEKEAAGDAPKQITADPPAKTEPESHSQPSQKKAQDAIAGMWSGIIRQLHRAMKAGTKPKVALYGLSTFCEGRGYAYTGANGVEKILAEMDAAELEKTIGFLKMGYPKVFEKVSSAANDLLAAPDWINALIAQAKKNRGVGGGTTTPKPAESGS